MTANETAPLVHIGYHKTGTTWLQQVGFSTLAGADVMVDRLTRSLLTELIETDDTPAVGMLRQRSDHVRACGRVPIFSLESLSGRVFHGSREAHRTLERLHDALPDARILVTVREQASMLVSLYALYVQAGGHVNFERFLASDAEGLDFDPDHIAFDDLVSQYNKTFPDVIVLPYEQLRGHPTSFLQLVGDRIDLNVEASPPATRSNPSLHGWRLQVLRRWNAGFRNSRFNPNPTLAVPRADAMRRVLQRSVPPPRGPSPHFPRARQFAQRYAESNQRLAGLVDLSGHGYAGVD